MRLLILTRAFLALLAGYYLYRTVVLPLPHLGPQPSDFSWYYNAARAILSGSSPFSVDGFVYPPLFAFLLTPFALLSYEAARWVWFWVNHAFLLASAFLLWRTLGGGRLALVSVVCVWALGGAITENLMLGQINPFLLLLLVVSWHRPESKTGAAGLGLAAATKIWPATLLATYALAGRWRTLLAAGCVFGLLLLLPWVAIWLFLPQPHVPPETRYWAGTPALFNLSLPAVTLRILDRPTAGQPLPHNWVFGNNVRELRVATADASVAITVAVAALLAGLVMLYRSAGSTVSSPNARFVLGALVALSLAVSPVSWSHYQLVQYPGVALLLVRFLQEERYGSIVLLGAVFGGLYQLPIAGLGPYLEQYGWTAGNPLLLWLLTTLTPVSSVALFALYLVELRRMRLHPPSQ